MKTDDLGRGSDLTPPPERNVLAEAKWGVGGGPPKTKSVQKKYLGIVAKIQNNRLSHFLMVEVQKFRGQI